jgi:hypothetical protein
LKLGGVFLNALTMYYQTLEDFKMTRSYIWQHTQLDTKAAKPSFAGRNIECAPTGHSEMKIKVEI